MILKVESRVGSKGELFPPKKIREKLGLKPHVKVVYRVEEGKLIVEPIPSLEDVLKEPMLIEITLEEFHKFRKELSRKVEF
jgi:AbrB family looped-hinge helix DNA binding protein